MSDDEEKPVPTRRGSGCLLTGLVLFLVFAFWATGFGLETTSIDLGPIQVFEGPDEIWLFVEIDRRRHILGAFASPTIIRSGVRQIVCVITADGVQSQFTNDAPLGVPFNGNLSCIYRSDGFYGFYSSSEEDSHLFKWEKDHFERLKNTETAEKLPQYIFKSRISDYLDGLSHENGWRIAFEETQTPWDQDIEIPDKKVRLRITTSKDEKYRYISAESLADRAWKKQMIEVYKYDNALRAIRN